MANYSSLGQNANVKKDENVVIFPYRILNDLSKKLNVAEAAIMKMSAEREALESVKNEEINKLKQQILGDTSCSVILDQNHNVVDQENFVVRHFLLIK